MRNATVVLLAVIGSASCLSPTYSPDPDEEEVLDRIVWLRPDSAPVLAGQHLADIAFTLDNARAAMSGNEVLWRVVAGGGTLSDSITAIDALLRSSVGWTVGTAGPQQLEARVITSMGDTVAARYTLFIGRLAIIDGDSQHVQAENPALARLGVQWLDYKGDPLPGQFIRWETELDGVNLPARTFANILGEGGTTVSYSAGAFGRSGHITAFMLNNPADSVRFTILTDHQLRLVSGGNQLGPVSTALTAPIVVAFDNLVDGESGPPTPFRWEVLSGGGAVLNSHIVSNRTNPMENRWTLGSTVGQQAIRIYQADGLGRDTVVVTATASAPGATGCGGSGTLHESGPQVMTSQTWSVAGSPHIVRGQVQFGPGANLTIDPGVTVCLEASAGLYLEGVLRAVGTPATPIRFAAADTTVGWGNVTLANTSGALNEISNARFSHGYTPIVAGAPARIDSTIIRQSRNFAILIDNSAATNRVIHTTVDTTGSLSNSSVVINAPGTVFSGTVRGSAGPAAVLITRDDVTLQECAVTGNGTYGVYVGGVTGTRIASCNLTANAGLAVTTSSGSTADARSNWWGTPAGATVGGPNGISTGVDASSPRIGEIDIGYRPVW